MKYKLTDEERGASREVAAKPLWRRVNVLDIIFVLAILAVAFVIASFFMPFSLFGFGRDERAVSYTVEIENVDGAMANLLAVGDTAFDAGGKNEIGVISAIKSDDTQRYRLDPESGGLAASAYPPDANGNIPKTLRITITATADYKAGGGYTVSGNRISVGTPLTLCFAEFTGTGNCISLYEIGVADGVN